MKTFIESNNATLNIATDQILADVDNNLKIIDEKFHPFKEFFENDVIKKPDNSTDVDWEDDFKLINGE